MEDDYTYIQQPGPSTDSNLVSIQLNLQDIVLLIENCLKNRTVYDETKDIWKRHEDNESIIPDKMVDKLMFPIRLSFNSHVVLGTLDNNVIENLANDTINLVEQFLMENMADCNLETKTDINMIVDSIHTLLFAGCLSRAGKNRSGEGRTFDKLNTQHEVRENITETRGKENNNLINLPFGGGGN